LRSIEPFDLDLARETYLIAWGATVVASDREGGRILGEISRAIRALPPPPGPPRPLDLLLDGLALLTLEGRTAGTPRLQQAAKALLEISVEDVLRWGWMATAASDAVWDNEDMLATAARTVQLARDAGALAQLSIHLSGLALARAWMGDLAGAASLVAEIDSVVAATGSRLGPGAALRLRSLQGREAETSALIASTIEHAAAGGHTIALYAHWAAAVLYNGLGRYQEAAASARQASSSPFEVFVAVRALPELVEAAARVGDTELAREALDRLSETTQPAGTNVALGIEARSRALLSDGVAANDLYREAIDRLSRTQLRPELARAHLLCGEWLRREGRRSDAREQLRTAHHMFAAIGMGGVRRAHAPRVGRDGRDGPEAQR
jgi:tetratricopeptide (TPR) repeat protein